ncbi:MAG: M28 family metallopeptidase [Turicibacter sp.]|nr:M28 family metallopeptidase [Turicibacter sp.]
MRPTIKTVLDRYGVRKSPAQKKAFREFLISHSQTHDYEILFQKYAKNGHNLIIGDPASAQIFLTAHYDTPPDFFMPIVASVGGIVPFTISQLIPVIPLLAILAILGRLIENRLAANIVREIFLLGLLGQMMFGVANKNNANDNTSGVALLLILLEDLPKELRDKACFVFFDDEEKGLIGSAKFKWAYKMEAQKVPVINFDCIAHGKQFIFSAKKGFRTSRANQSFQEALEKTFQGKDYSFGTAWRHIYTSDQLHFKKGLGVAAAHRLPFIGPVLNRIHTRRDVMFDEENIEALKELLTAFISKLD